MLPKLLFYQNFLILVNDTKILLVSQIKNLEANFDQTHFAFLTYNLPGILVKSTGIKFSKILTLSISTATTCVSYLLWYNYSRTQCSKTTRIYYFTQFLRVRNLEGTLLGGSGSGSLMKLQTVDHGFSHLNWGRILFWGQAGSCWHGSIPCCHLDFPLR